MNLVETTSTTLCSIKHFSIDGFWHPQEVTDNWTWTWANWEMVRDKEDWHAAVHNWETKQEQQQQGVLEPMPHGFQRTTAMVPSCPYNCIVKTLAQIKEFPPTKSLLSVHFKELPKRRAWLVQKSSTPASKSQSWPEVDLPKSTGHTQQHTPRYFLLPLTWRTQGSTKLPFVSQRRTYASTNLNVVLTSKKSLWRRKTTFIIF